MATPPMLLDIARTLLALAAPAALLCLVLAGIALRRDGGRNFSIGGGFSRWMFWAVVFLTLPQLMAWFPALGVPAELPTGGITSGWMASLTNDISSFATNFVVNQLATVVAASFVLRAVLESGTRLPGGHITAAATGERDRHSGIPPISDRHEPGTASGVARNEASQVAEKGLAAEERRWTWIENT